MPKIVTANNLRTGAVVFLGFEDAWVPDVAEALVFDGAEAAEDALATAQKKDAQVVVDPFVTDKAPDTEDKPGMTLRDRIRAFGPTIHFLPADEKAA